MMMWKVRVLLLNLLATNVNGLATVQPQTLGDLVQSFRSVYSDLEQQSVLSYPASPTLRFERIAAPNATHSALERSVWQGVDPGDADKPLALYLPGLDGFGISATAQYNDLASTFETWRLFVSLNDTSSFIEVVDAIVDFVQERAVDRKFILMGESCGGLLSAAVAYRLRKTDLIDGLVLVNPATSFAQTWWDTLVPLLASLPNTRNSRDYDNDDSVSPYALLGGLILSLAIPDGQQQQRIFDTIRNLPSLQQPPSLDQLQHVLATTQDALRVTEQRLPPDVLEHRVTKWLLPGAAAVPLSKIEVPTLVIGGQEDALMPSASECERLVELLPNADKLLVPNRGHFVLDDTVNLTEAVVYSKRLDPLGIYTDKKRKKYDPIIDWTLPTGDELQSVLNGTVQPLQRIHSPVFFSTDSKGTRRRGLTQVPRAGPILFVGNHQFFAADLNLIFPQMLEELGYIPRGLAHPVAVGTNLDEWRGRTPGLPAGSRSGPGMTNFQAFGAVPVTPRNFYRLLQSGQPTMLFPGGAAEALSIDRDYALAWPQDKTDFVRTAARFNATIVPFSAIGMVDGVNGILKVEDTFDLPLIGDQLRQGSANVTAARFDRNRGADNLGFPVFTPAMPARNYFLFGSAIETADVDPNDKAACERVYAQAKGAVEEGLVDLQEARKEDPFGNTPKRLAYEQVFQKTAPTFPVELLNAKQ